MTRVNPFFYSLAICAAPLLGSVSSAIAIGGMIFGGGHLLTGRFVRRPPAAVHCCTAAFAAFFFAELLAQLASSSPMVLDEVIENLPFLGLYLIYVCTTASRARILDGLEWTAAAVSLVAVVLLMLPGFAGTRLELMAGNPSVLAVLIAIVYLFNLVAMARGKHGWHLALFAAAALCSIVILGNTETRAIWPAMLLLPVLVLLMLRPELRRIRIGKASWMAVPVAAVLVAVLWAPVSARWAGTLDDLQAIQVGDTSGSLGQRLVLWQSAMPIIAENPVIGVGPSNSMKALGQKSEELYDVQLGFSHAHNMVVTELLRAGIVGLLALLGMFLVPLAVVGRAARDRDGQAGFAILIGVQCIYIFSGATGLAVGHDILDAVFITSTALCLYLVFGIPSEDQSASKAEDLNQPVTAARGQQK